MKCYLFLIERCLFLIPGTSNVRLFFPSSGNRILAEEMKFQHPLKCLSKAASRLYYHDLLIGYLTGIMVSPRELLFSRNRLTYFQAGIYFHWEKLAALGRSPFIRRAVKFVEGCTKLKTHSEKPEPGNAIAEDNFDIGVLQGYLPEINNTFFRQYTHLFIAKIRKVDARPMRLMAWSCLSPGYICVEEGAKEFQDAATERSIKVVPVAIQWQRSIIERPVLDLHAVDWEHLSIFRIYFASCVVLTTIFSASSTGFRYVASGMRMADIYFLHRIARETRQQWRAA